MTALPHALWLATSLAAQPKEVPPRDTAALEIGFHTGLQRSNVASSAVTYSSYRPTALATGLSLALRSRYLLIPLLKLSRMGLVEGSRATAASGTVQTQLYAWAYRAGVSADLWRLRPTLGIALYDLNVRTRAHGQSYASRELDFG